MLNKEVFSSLVDSRATSLSCLWQ